VEVTLLAMDIIFCEGSCNIDLSTRLPDVITELSILEKKVRIISKLKKKVMTIKTSYNLASSTRDPK
jgi:hypothetical protein